MNENMKQKRGAAGDAKRFRPEFTLYKANAKGTGCALRLSLHPASGDEDGAIWATFANQLTIGDMRGPKPVCARFDWENRICVKLDFLDLSAMLQVLRGGCESVGNGKGLCHRSSRGMTHIGLKRLLEPVDGFSFEVHRAAAGGGDDAHAHIFVAPHEAMGLCAAIESSLAYVCFGVPEPAPRNTQTRQSDANNAKETGHAEVA